jgi:hypothetical protein
LFHDLKPPIVHNALSAESISLLLSGVSFPWAPTFTAVRLAPKDSRFFIRREKIASLRESFIRAIPLCANVVTPSVADALSSGLFVNLFPQVTLDLRAVTNYELADGLLFVNDGQTTRIVEKLLSKFENELPLNANDFDEEAIDTIVNRSLLFNLPFTINVAVVSSVHPFERRIAFTIPPLCSDFLNTMPVLPNSCSGNTLMAIVQPLNPLDIFNFSRADCAALLDAFAPPEYPVELIDDIVNRLVVLILARDVCPALPICPEVARDIVGVIVVDVFAVFDSVDHVAELGIEFLAQMRPNDIPAFMTPDEVIRFVLHDQVLPSMHLIKPRDTPH